MTDKEFNGAIAAFDSPARILTMVDEHGVTHPFKWTTGAQDEFFQKQKIGYGLTLKYDEDSRAIKSAAFWKKPEGFSKNKGGQNWQPKKPRVTIAATVNLQNYENIKVEVEDRMHFLHRKCPLYHPAFYPERIYMIA